jgi:hypothetical protein
MPTAAPCAGAAPNKAAAPPAWVCIWVCANAVCKGKALKPLIKKTKPKRRVGENEFIELTFFSGKTNTQATAVPIVLRQYTASLGFYFPQTPYWGKPTNSLQVCNDFYKRIRFDDMS